MARPQGFTKVPYLRVDHELWNAVNERTAKERRRSLNKPSRADVVRELLWKALADG